MKLYLLLLCQYLHAINFPSPGRKQEVGENWGPPSHHHEEERAVKNQNQAKHGARAKCRNVCREHFPWTRLQDIPLPKYPNTQQTPPPQGLPQFTLKVLLTKESKTSGWHLVLCCWRSCYYCIWRWWWAMITRYSAPLCSVLRRSLPSCRASFGRILCGRSFGSWQDLLPESSG